ncbi:Ankyrin repeat-containing protein [Colletotrichum orbiculare MAFF 240422]|uniref:Ankyrin repeat-containing protein n=1 Tax=Colletotrichum orbiculare (strain 104-T / ATCC 96160 / CBS 514.97 / LARS 414 / MAFF 240422) TaxID=1213857 RepID=A0A484FMK8_COLOR|nr:Ankyrin repeat-containing protein [Colletotrichum orbiculare MAFF 240422]
MLIKAQPGLAAREDDDGRLPIHWAASSNSLEIVLLLTQLQSFDPDVQDSSGWTPLMIAASLKDGEDLVSLLLQKGANVSLNNLNGQSVLHFVASKNNLDVARMLLNHEPPASTRARDIRGQYPIHRAAAVGSVPMTKLLINHKSPINATDVSGYTALHHAVAEGHGDTAVVLLKAGAEFDKKDADGQVALDLAPDREVRRYIERAAEGEVRVYLEKPAALTLETPFQVTVHGLEVLYVGS